MTPTKYQHLPTAPTPPRSFQPYNLSDTIRRVVFEGVRSTPYGRGNLVVDWGLAPFPGPAPITCEYQQDNRSATATAVWRNGVSFQYAGEPDLVALAADALARLLDLALVPLDRSQALGVNTPWPSTGSAGTLPSSPLPPQPVFDDRFDSPSGPSNNGSESGTPHGVLQPSRFGGGSGAPRDGGPRPDGFGSGALHPGGFVQAGRGRVTVAPAQTVPQNPGTQVSTADGPPRPSIVPFPAGAAAALSGFQQVEPLQTGRTVPALQFVHPVEIAARVNEEHVAIPANSGSPGCMERLRGCMSHYRHYLAQHGVTPVPVGDSGYDLRSYRSHTVHLLRLPDDSVAANSRMLNIRVGLDPDNGPIPNDLDQVTGLADLVWVTLADNTWRGQRDALLLAIAAVSPVGRGISEWIAELSLDNLAANPTTGQMFVESGDDVRAIPWIVAHDVAHYLTAVDAHHTESEADFRYLWVSSKSHGGSTIERYQRLNNIPADKLTRSSSGSLNSVPHTRSAQTSWPDISLRDVAGHLPPPGKR